MGSLPLSKDPVATWQQSADALALAVRFRMDDLPGPPGPRPAIPLRLALAAVIEDEAVPLAQSTHMQAALKANGVRGDLIIIPNGAHSTGMWHTVPGVPDWEKQMIEWLNLVLEHRGPVGEGIRPRTPAPPATGG